MKWKNILTKFLAIAGTVFVWFPILVPLVFAFGSLITDGRFQFDFLMPAELFPVILAGWVLLILAAVWARSRVKWIAWAAGSAVGVALIGAVLTRVTGLATGETEPTGWLLALLVVIFALFWLAIIATGVGGILLLIDLFRGSKVPISPK
jgi:hypothetical protein